MQVEVGFIAFHKFKPYFVHKLKDFNSCYCWYHHEMLDRFNNMRASTMYHGSQDGKFCTCGCKAICANPGHKTIVITIISCQTIKRTYRSTFDLWLNLLCPKEMGQKWFRLDYVIGFYTQCGIMRLSICDRKFDPSK